MCSCVREKTMLAKVAEALVEFGTEVNIVGVFETLIVLALAIVMSPEGSK